MASLQEKIGVPHTSDRGCINNDVQIDEAIGTEAVHDPQLTFTTSLDAKLDQDAALRQSARGIPFSDDSVQSRHQRLEALLEQQNMLLSQQLELAEKNAKNSARAAWQRNTVQDVLKTLDPCMKAICVQWKKQFCRQVAIYVAQSRKYSKLQSIASKGELVPPFSKDAKQLWYWPEFYRSNAQPLKGVDFASTPESNGFMGSSTDSPETYDVDQAFAYLRQRHAWESQAFVLGHQKTCVDRLFEDLSLECQTKKLRDQVTASMAEQGHVYPSQAKRDLESQATVFAEVVHGAEMQMAEKKIREEYTCPPSLLLGLRIVVVFVILLAVMTMSSESLMRVFAIIFALGCGMALLWEDVLVLSVRFLLGHSIKRMETFMTHAPPINVNLPIAFWQ